MKYLDQNGVLYLWNKVKALIPTKVSQLTNDSGYLTEHQDISGKLDKTGDGQNVIVAFSTASTRTNVVTGEKLSTMFGKIAKWFTDMKKVAFTGSYNDLSDLPDIPSDNAQLSNGAGYQTADQCKAIATSYGYQTATQVNTAIEGKGYQTLSQVESAIAGKGYQTESQVQAIVNSAVSGITGISFEVVASLPTTGQAGVIYLVSNSGSDPNIYDEYIWVNTKFEKIGTTAVDLSGYMLKTDMVAITNAEIDTICA